MTGVHLATASLPAEDGVLQTCPPFEKHPYARHGRTPAMAGIKGGRFEPYVVRKRVYATGWDGTVRIDFSLNRDYRTRTEGSQ